jgi:putative salt-induced outer membrane protein
MKVEVVRSVGLASLVIMLVLIWMFRSVRGVVIPIALIWLGVLWTIAVMMLAGSYGRGAQGMTARRFFGQMKQSYDFAEHAYAFGMLAYESDRFSGYHYSVSESAGIGWRLIETGAFHLDGEIGPTFRQSLRRADQSRENLMLMRLGIIIAWRISPTAAFTNETAILASHERIEVTTVAGGRREGLVTRNQSELTMPIIGDVAGRVAVRVNYTSSPPRDAAALDTRTQLGMVYTF